MQSQQAAAQLRVGVLRKRVRFSQVGDEAYRRLRQGVETVEEPAPLIGDKDNWRIFDLKGFVDFLHYDTMINCFTGAIISETHIRHKYILVTKCSPPQYYL
jgi:hypothetical protein